MAVIAEQQQLDLREPKGWRRTSNRIVTALMVIAFVVVVIPLGFVLVTTVGLFGFTLHAITGWADVALATEGFAVVTLVTAARLVWKIQNSAKHPPL